MTSKTKPPQRRRWPAELVADLVHRYEALPVEGGLRTAFLRENAIASAQMTIWRKKHGSTRPATATGNGVQPEGVVGPRPVAVLVDAPTPAFLQQMAHWRDAYLAAAEAMDRAIAAVRKLAVDPPAMKVG